MRTQPVSQSIYSKRQSGRESIADACLVDGTDNDYNIDTSDSDMEPAAEEEEESGQRAQV